MVALVGGAGAVLEDQALEAAIVGLAHRGVHADIGGDAGEHEIVDAARAQHQLEIRGTERTLARLVDHRFARCRRQLGDDLPPRLAAHQDAAARAGIADAGAELLGPPALVRGQVGQIRPMAFARMDHGPACLAGGGEQPADRFDRCAGQRQIVAHLVDVAADSAEIGLHVDDDQRAVAGPQVAIPGPEIGTVRHVLVRHGFLPNGPPRARRGRRAGCARGSKWRSSVPA